MPTRVIIHPGFHKTGTSTLQKYFEVNRRALSPYLAYYGKADLGAAGSAARAYGQRPTLLRRWAFRQAFRTFLDAVPDDPIIVISRETLVGVMPGHRNWRGQPVRSYVPTSKALGRTICRAIRARFPGAHIEYVFTTRASDEWIGSVHGHLLRSIKLTEDLGTFKSQFVTIPDLDDSAAKIAQALSLHAHHVIALEDHGHRPGGPAAALLDLINIPQDVRDELNHVTQQNIGQPSDLRSKFLALNRDDTGPGTLKWRKHKLLENRHE